MSLVIEITARLAWCQENGRQSSIIQDLFVQIKRISDGFKPHPSATYCGDRKGIILSNFAHTVYAYGDLAELVN